MKAPILYLPVAMLACLAGLASVVPGIRDRALAPSGDLPSVASSCVPSATCQIELKEGFTSSYSSDTQSWRWQYAQLMPDGCQKLLFKENPVQVIGSTVRIELKTYQPDDACTAVMTVRGVRGGIALPADAKFNVFVDGKQVYP